MLEHAPATTGNSLLLRRVERILGRGTEWHAPLDVRIEDGLITEIGPDLAAISGVQEIDGHGHLLAPGLVNAHWHSPMQPAHGTSDRLDHKRFMWLNQADTAGRSSDEIEVSCLLGCIQMIRTGTTAVLDHFPEQGFGVSDVDAIVKAYGSSGMRAVVALRVFDGEYADIMPEPHQRSAVLDAEIAASNPLSPSSAEATMDLLEECLTRFGSKSPLIKLFPAPSNPIRCSDRFLQAVHGLAVSFNAGIHCHLLETQRQAELAQARYGRSMIEHLHTLGILDNRWSYAHCNWLSAPEISLLAEHGGIVILNPECNLKIGSGLPPIPALIQSGVVCALGTDGASTNDNLILQEAMQLAAIMHRLSEQDRHKWVTAEDVFTMGTMGGALALREPTLGRVEVGYKADLVLYDLDSPAWLPLNDGLQQFVFGERGAGVRTVIVNGRLILHEDRIISFDEAAVKSEARNLLVTTRSRNPHIQRIAQAFV